MCYTVSFSSDSFYPGCGSAVPEAVSNKVLSTCFSMYLPTMQLIVPMCFVNNTMLSGALDIERWHLDLGMFYYLSR